MVKSENMYKNISLRFILRALCIWCAFFLLTLFSHWEGYHKNDYNFRNYRLFSEQKQISADETEVAALVEESKLKFLVDTKVCKILDVDPFNSSIKHLLDLHPETIVCDDKKEFTYIEKNTLFINKSRRPHGVTYCRFQPIFNWPPKSFIFGNKSQKFISSIPVTDEFIKIECFNSSDTVIVENFLMQFVHKKNVEETLPSILENQNSEQLNVILIMQDSLSRINSRRYMPKTRRYLLEKLGAVEMLGYNKVADNTRVNMVPLLTGDFDENQACFKDKQGLDNCSFIWKQFSQKGYVTHLGEDWPYYGIFLFNLPGFKKQPTDYYDYPFHKADEGDGEYRFNGCFQGKLWAETLYNRTTDIAINLRHKRLFSLTLQKRHTHDYITGAASIDDSTVNVLSKMYRNDLLNNTFLAMFGDHGNRFGDIRQTVVGQLEERLPLMFIYVPVWFRRKYNKYFKNLNINSRRLTTHFDMHSTLLHLLELDREIPKMNKGISLFNEIPYNRSCRDARIRPHWCTCNYHLTSKVDIILTKVIASTVVVHLNNLLKKSNATCQVLALKEIKSCFKMLSRNGKTEEYKVVIVTNPNDAVLEATVGYQNQRYKVKGDISRLNKYKGQSDCIKDYRLRKFCMCKK